MITNLLTATATGAGQTSAYAPGKAATFQASGATTESTGAASVNIEVSNDGVTWLTLGTITLTLGTTATGDGFASTAPWAFVRANVASISGTGASVTVTMGL